MTDISQEICEQVEMAAAERKRLRIRGADTKSFYGRKVSGDPLETSRHDGIVNYEPTELVLTARAGTRLNTLEKALAERGQGLPFEPPHFGDGATLGGTIACGFSGPRRPYAGAARDFVLGLRLINGKGEHLRFGGEVMKNVAGYDVSRLMVGALGTLGVITEVSLKVLPVAVREETLVFTMNAAQAIETMNKWSAQPLPVSATCHVDDRLYVRLSGSENGVRSASGKLGGEAVTDGADFWRNLREHQHGFFSPGGLLWRLSVPAAAPQPDLPGHWLIEWGGALRWLKTPANPAQVRTAATAAGGHAICFRGSDGEGEVFHPLSGGLMALHRQLKTAFDPVGIFNPGKMYAEL